MRAAIPEASPRVCVHVPCYNEPPAMVMRNARRAGAARLRQFRSHRSRQQHARARNLATGGSALRDAWPAVSLLSLWPCEGLQGRRAQHCAGAYGSRRQIYRRHRQRLSASSPIGCVATLPLFAAPEIALVQGPQDYRDAHDSLFKAMAFEEYRGFFQIGMVERNEHNAIIQHGTMTIVRHDALGGSGRLEHMVHHRRHRTRLEVCSRRAMLRPISRRAWAPG